MRVCLDLNVWIADLLATRAGRSATAAQLAVAAVRGGPARIPLQLVISWGMLQRLEEVLLREFRFTAEPAADLVRAIVGYAHAGPTLSLGGVGVLPIHDAEDRHVLETAWAGQAEALVTADLRGFVRADAEMLQQGRLARLRRGDRTLHVVHPFLFAAWLRGEAVEGFEPVA
jgi:predicted nucleic acid-binding protein